VLWHKNRNRKPREDLKVVEHLVGKAMGENTVADRTSKELCEALPGGH